MRLPSILMCVMLLPVAAAMPSHAAPTVQRAAKTKLGKVTLERGRAKLVPMRVPDDRRDAIEVIEIAPTGISDLANPDDRGIFVGKLRRGRKAKLSAGDPADKGVALMAMAGATSVPLYIGLHEPGIHLRGESGHGDGVSIAGSGLAAIVFAPGVMQGDDIAIECSGEFPSQVGIRVMHLSATEVDGAEHDLDGSSGQLVFVVPTAGMTDGILVASMKPKNGNARVEKCVVTREAE